MSQRNDGSLTHYHIDLSVGVSHVADDAAILHSVQLFSGDNVLVACLEIRCKHSGLSLSLSIECVLLGPDLCDLLHILSMCLM